MPGPFKKKTKPALIESKASCCLTRKSCSVGCCSKVRWPTPPVKEALMVSAIHRGVIKGLALAPLLGLLYTHAFGLDRTISQFYHSGAGAARVLPAPAFFQTVWFM